MVRVLTEISFVAFRLGMIVFTNTVCSSSTNGTKYT